MTPLPPAVLAAYRDVGWHITPGGHPDTGLAAGPCVGCGKPCARYGRIGRTHCYDCRTGGDRG